MASTQQLLDSVEAAIYALTNKHVFSYSVQGRTFTAHDLDRLVRWRNQIKQEIDAAASGGRSRCGLVTFGATT